MDECNQCVYGSSLCLSPNHTTSGYGHFFSRQSKNSRYVAIARFSFLHKHQELRAIHLAYGAFLPHIKGKILHILRANTVAMLYENRQGGARSDSFWQALGVVHHQRNSPQSIPSSQDSQQFDRLAKQICQLRSWVVSQVRYHETHFSNCHLSRNITISTLHFRLLTKI